MDEANPKVAGEVVALLGATNTGKTHRAIEQMLDHPSGMLGLPLRLLAREVYERVTARVGERAVALVTGEEKRVPQAPRYWVCTTEAMPRDVGVDFVALDEVQLVGHPERGHIFTERVRSWRGARETWLLGSSTAEGLLRQLVPGLRVQHFPRLSQLSHLGRRSLRSLPRRSAVVTFTVDEVYRLAEVLRERKGGAAVVLGGLSPRARNAQVAMYEAGEVDYLVATDAIGMGLNLDIDHVGLASLDKFDGFEHRPLDAAELGQIVGRAGRHMRDGTFGTVSPLPTLSPGLSRSLEQHRFAPLDFAYYRNDDLCFESLESLLASLSERPPRDAGPLKRAPDADDLLALRALGRDESVRRRLGGEEATRLLWDVCHIPNYEGHIPEHHAQILAQVFELLMEHGAVPEPWLAARLRRLDTTAGTLHELTARVAAVRTFSYVVHQAGWLARPGPLRERTRGLEERLSEALHESLRARFVEPRTRNRGARRAGSPDSATAKRGPFAKLAEHALYVDPQAESARARERWVEALVGAGHEDIALSATGGVSFRGEAVGQWLRGSDLLHPALRLLLPEWVGGGMRRQLERRLAAFTKDATAELLDPLRGGDSPAQSGLLYLLRSGLGSANSFDARAQVELLAARDRAGLHSRGVVLGRRVVYAEHALSEALLCVRSALLHAFEGLGPGARLPVGGPAAFRDGSIGDAVYLRAGYRPVGHHVVRCDVLEQLFALRADAPADGDVLSEVACLLQLPPLEAEQVWRGLRRRRRRSRRRR